MNYTIVLSFDPDGEVWGSCTVDGILIPTFADNVAGVVANIRMMIEDFCQHEFKDLPKWQDVDVNAITFELEYSLVDFFDNFSFLKISEVAKAAKLNPSLVRGYANGDKNPSLAQAQKIQEAAHRLARSLLAARIVPTTVRQAI